MDTIEYKDLTIRPLTAATLSLLQRVKSPLASGDLESIDAVMDYIYVSSQPLKVCKKSAQGDWRDKVTDFADQFTMEDIAELSKILNGDVEEINESVVDTKEDDSKK